MAKKNSPAPKPAPKKSASGNLGKPFPFREPPEFEGLVAAVDVFAKRKSRSRNMAIVIILAKAMREAGLYHPPADIEID